ncbi:MAG: GNAT family N-acetyltransferase [Gemmataceae bacterium]
MTTILKKIPFDAELLPLVSDFNCAEAEPAKFWEEEINDWIRMDAATGDGALFWMRKGTQVWLYANEKDEIVGYGSLCESRWPDPAIVEKVPKIKRVPISLIPAVGLDRRFRGGPEGAEREERYSTKILRHLIHEARRHANRQPFLGLYVHPQNDRAIRLYRREHFEDFSQKYWHAKAGVEYTSMILKLMGYPSTEEE